MSLQGLPEPVAWKRARPVLRGPRRSNAPGLPDEVWFGIIERQAIRRGTFRSVRDLMIKIGFIWTKTATEVLDKIDRKRNAISTTRH